MGDDEIDKWLECFEAEMHEPERDSKNRVVQVFNREGQECVRCVACKKYYAISIYPENIPACTGPGLIRYNHQNTKAAD